ncbi:inverted formin-2 [Triticum aestivum]|uniref:inverted formin-2 n=1 Tax=Triticum aestivum TaxID=4565 RepID=UPI001D00C0B2|nr:inverted formin-2-like [Triticum aestivum]
MNKPNSSITAGATVPTLALPLPNAAASQRAPSSAPPAVSSISATAPRRSPAPPPSPSNSTLLATQQLLKPPLPVEPPPPPPPPPCPYGGHLFAGIISGENGTLNRVFQYVCPSIWRTVSPGRTLASWLPLPAGVPPPCYSDEWCSASAPFRAALPGVGHSDDKVLVFVLAATSMPYALDQAVRRQFDKRILHSFT